MSFKLRTVSLGLAVLIALLLGSSSVARAQTTDFDFDTSGPNQSGAYTVDAGAELSGGEARLVAQGSPPWYNPAWVFRLPVLINNPGSTTLLGHPVRIVLDNGPALLFDGARLDGADLLPVDEAGNPLTERWVEELDFIARRGTLWVKLPALPPGTTRILVYFGNPAWFDGGSPEAFFADQSGWTTHCVVSPVAAQLDLVVQSFVDNNTIAVVGGTFSQTLQARESATIAAAELSAGTFLSGTGAFYGTFVGDDVDALAPVSMAATEFVYPAVRGANNDEWDVVSPFGDATVSVYDNGTLVLSQVVPAATPMTLPAEVGEPNVATITSDLPILVHHHADDTGADNDAYVLSPPAREIFGGSTGNTYLVALEDGTLVDVYTSSGTHQSYTLTSTSVQALHTGASQGDGPALHVIADGPVMAMSYGDGDGGEAITFLPRSELGRRFVLPRQAEYVFVTTAHPATTCRILDPTGTEVTMQNSNTYAPPYPNKLRFTAAAAGHELSCDKPVWAVFEDSVTNTERNLWPIKAHRPRVAAEPTTALGALEPLFAFDRGTVITPTFEAPFAVARWTAFVETASVPSGAGLLYQLSDDGGQTWYFHTGTAWAAAANPDQSNYWWEVHEAIETFPPEANQVTVRAILRSENGSVTPELDNLRLYYQMVASADQFVFEPIASPQVAGRPFTVTIRAADDLGRTIGSFNDPAFLQTLAGQTEPNSTPSFVNGAITLEVAVLEVGPAVQLYTYTGGLSGTSDPFEVLSPDATGIELVSGDQQFARAGEAAADPLVVRAVSSDGDPAPLVDITFVVSGGGGNMGEQDGEPITEQVVTTDVRGEAQVNWTLGPMVGAHRLEARLEGAAGSPVVFTARGDPNPDIDTYELRGEGGGCSCRTSAPATGWPLGLLLVLGLLLARRRRR